MMEMQWIAPDDQRLTWGGVVSLERGEGWVQPWRIPEAERAFYDATGFLNRACCTAGVRLRLRADAEREALRRLADLR